MPLRSPAGFISAFFDPLKNPDAPTSPEASAGDTSADVSFTAPTNAGGSAITAYYAVSNPGQITGTSATSPVSVTGLTNGTAYTFQVWALNSYGPGPWSAATSSITPSLQRGLWGGGETTSSVMQYISIASTGNSTSFGNLTVARYGLAACASTTRGVFSSGYASNFSGVMDYVTIDTTGNAVSFGSANNAAYIASCSSNTRGLIAGGYTFGSQYVSTINYITIATTGNTTSFGYMANTPYGGVNGISNLTGCASPTRGIFAGGADAYASTNLIQYVTIATTGNATSFGQLTVARGDLAGASSSTRGVFAGGINYPTYYGTIDYITIATTGNAVYFGGLSPGSVKGISGCSSPSRAVFGGGYNAGFKNAIEYVTIATTGNSATFGTLLSGIQLTGSCSNCHGGL